MSDQRPGREAGEGGSQRARRIALDDEDGGSGRQPRKERGGDCADVAVRVLLSGAVQPFGGERREAEISRVQLRVLAREDQRAVKPALGQCMGQRGQLDRFGPGPDDQANVYAIQPSP